MKIVLHGPAAAVYEAGLRTALGDDAEVQVLPGKLESEQDKSIYTAADCIVGTAFSARFPRPSALRLFQVTGAGLDQVELEAVPATAIVCNCYEHENAIAEYVIAALLQHEVPLIDADRRLRKGEWPYRMQYSRPGIAGKTIGILGYGRIGKAVATLAKAFRMRVAVANRSTIEPSGTVDRAVTLDRLDTFWPDADFIVCALPLTPETKGLVDARAFASMKNTALLVNVGRGSVVDEEALFTALKKRTIGGAVIDTWYRYPDPANPRCLPANLPFHELDNIIMTPHMSGWTRGVIERRLEVMAENIRRVMAGQPCLNVIRSAFA